MDSSSGNYLWCAREAGGGGPRSPSFLTSAELKELGRERKVLASLGSGPSFAAKEAVAAVEKLHADPRAPEVLHLAVRATRFGCKDKENSAQSKAAFEALHARYPNSSWAKETPYYY
jgi:hypothetical protein